MPVADKRHTVEAPRADRAISVADCRLRTGDIEQSIPDRFAQQCRFDDRRIAILTPAEAFTYAELDAWSDAIAAPILARAGGRSRPVPFLLPQSPLAVAVTLAILKSGNIYVPLDPAWGTDRLAALCRNLAPPCLLTDAELAPLLRESSAGAEVVELPHTRPQQALPLPAIGIAPTDPAYVYFTSGSTGAPKGVVDCHRNVLHNVLRYTRALAIDDGDRLTLLQPCAFSGAVSSMFAALANGAAVLPIDMRRETPARIAEWIEASGATIYHSVPAIFRSLLTRGRRFTRLRIVRLEGDRATRADLEGFRAHVAPPCRLAIGLGATETGLVCQYFYDHAMPTPDGVVPIGYPVEDVRVEVRENGGAVAPPHAAGEIIVTSRYLALGYWNDAAATARAFGDTGPGGERSYRTGDLGRLAGDGCLDYLGRLDGRARVRGHWVELADVDAAIAALPGVSEAITGAVESASREAKLVAWFVPESDDPPNASALHRALASSLPPHMLPARYVPIARMPLNGNGKVDRASLPRPGDDRPSLATPYRPARDLAQVQLCELWERLLDLHPVGIHDDFFELGGDSLLAATMMDEVRASFGIDPPLSALLPGATVAQLACALAADARRASEPIVLVRDGGPQPPLYFLHGDYHSGGLYCRELARHLEPSRAFYALPPFGFDGNPIPPTYAAAAQIHLDAIRSVQPRGPYHLGGQCNGGLVALEIARRIRASGEGVASLTLVGASAQNVRYRAMMAIIEAAGRVAGVRAAARRHAFRRLRDFAITSRGATPSRRLRLTLNKLDVLRREAAHVARTRSHAAASLHPGPLADEGYRARIREHYVDLDRDYVPSRYRGRATLLWPRDDPSRVQDEVQAWRRVVEHLDVVVIPGDGKTCLTRHVRDLAAAMQAALGEGGIERREDRIRAVREAESIGDPAT